MISKDILKKLRVSKERLHDEAARSCSVCNTLFPLPENLNTIIIRDGAKERPTSHRVLICERCLVDFSRLVDKVELVGRAVPVKHQEELKRITQAPEPKKQKDPNKQESKTKMYW